MSGQAAPKEGDFVVGEQARARCLDADGNEWVGVPGNFPGVVAEWRWLQPDSAGPYHVHMGKLAIGRTRMQQIVPGEVEAAAQMLASRLSGGVIDGPRLITEGRDCAGEFDLGQADDPLLYLSTIGIIVMNAEHQAAEHVRHLTVVTDTDIRRIMSSRE